MPKKGNSNTSKKTSKTKKSDKNNNYYDDVEEFRNSEDEYASSDAESDVDSNVDSNIESDVDSNIESDVEYESDQSGGASDAADDQLDDDNSTLDIDPDDEADVDVDGDEKYNPIDEIDEPVDEDQGSELDEHGIDEVDPDSVDASEFIGDNKKCHMKNINKDKDFIALDDDDSNLYGKMEYKRIPDDERETDAVITWYEMVRIIGTRTQQLNYDAQPLVKGVEGLPPAKIAYIELQAKMTPFIIKRKMPGKKYEEWKIDELEIIHEITEEMFVPGKFDWNQFSDKNPNINTNSRIISDHKNKINLDKSSKSPKSS
ncbi:DNA-directed RNA polymerase subunit 6, partial [Bandra megavirus]